MNMMFCSNENVFVEPATQRVPLRIFKTHDSYNDFVPILFDPMPVSIDDSYPTPNTICYGTFDPSKASYICSLYGFPESAADNALAWWEIGAGWDNSGADYYVGDPASDNIGSLDLTNVYAESVGHWNWNFVPSSEPLCLDQTNILSIKCGSSDYCVESQAYCAMDLDCCGDMFCHPIWGYCVNTV